MKAKGRILSFIDIGTNSIRLLLVRINPNNSYTLLRQEKELARLGENEFSNGLLKPKAMSRAILVCRKFAEVSKAYGSTQIIAVATSATREARNQPEFLARMRREAGLSVKVISGKEEARLIYLGVASGIHLKEGKAAFIDIGGGSTEIIIGDATHYSYMESTEVGAVRLTGMFLRDGAVGMVPGKTYKEIKLYTRNKMLRAAERIRTERIEQVYGSSGTIINLGEISSKLNHKTAHGGNSVLRRKDLKKISAKLCSLPLEQRKKIQGINPDRADIIVAGAAILETFMEESKFEEIKISDRSLLHGMLIDYLSKQRGFPQYQKMPVRERSVLQIGRSCSILEAHAKKISMLAVQLFDSARELRMHGLGKKERELLHYAAFLHDVGNFISFTNHHQHSHYIINNAELLGFDQIEVKIMAETARYHRKKTPKKKELVKAGFDEHSIETIIILSSLLRVAESLDRSHKGLITRAEFTRIDNKAITLTIWSTDKCELEKWSIESNSPIYKKVFNRILILETRNSRNKKNKTNQK